MDKQSIMFKVVNFLPLPYNLSKEKVHIWISEVNRGIFIGERLGFMSD